MVYKCYPHARGSSLRVRPQKRFKTSLKFQNAAQGDVFFHNATRRQVKVKPAAMTPTPAKMSDSTNLNQLIGQKTQLNNSWSADQVRSGAEGPDFRRRCFLDGFGEAVSRRNGVPSRPDGL